MQSLKGLSVVEAHFLSHQATIEALGGVVGGVLPSLRVDVKAGSPAEQMPAQLLLASSISGGVVRNTNSKTAFVPEIVRMCVQNKR